MVNKSQHNEHGFVSLFTVVFFALLATVITIGFLRIMTLEQKQAIDNDLTARAFSAAEAGIEDGKRAILAYAQLAESDPNKAAFRTALNSNACDALFGATSPIATAIGLKPDGEISPSNQQNLYYRCLNVHLNTADYIGSLDTDKSQIIPLKGEGSFNSVNFSWHLNSMTQTNDGDGLTPNLSSSAWPTSSKYLPPVGEFTQDGQSPPAYMRLQLFGVPKSGNFDRNTLDQRSFTAFLTPLSSSASGAKPLPTNVTMQAGDPRGFNQLKSSPYAVQCMEAEAAEDNIGNYACKAALGLPSGALDTNNNNYYLRITPIYRRTHFRVELQSGGSIVNFNEVQPIIDSTGSAAADVYRRIVARTTFPGQAFAISRFGFEIADSVCKDFFITDNTANFVDNSSECSDNP
ncbi:MAG TPA: hypothetical protein VFZ58_03790 [Candidatus Saccharimonadales bacterium]